MLILLLLLAASLLPTPAHSESFQAWAARGARQARAGDDRAALETYTNALASWESADGKSARAKVYCARAQLRERAGDAVGATSDYTECLAVETRNARAFDRRGRLRLNAGRVTAALDDFYKAVAVDIAYGPAYYDRARAYSLQGDKKFAREDYRRACGLGVKEACPKAGRRSTGAKKIARPLTSVLTAACRDAAKACADDGSTFGDCVAKAPVCERSTQAGCCPSACALAMRRALDAGRSDAAAFRDVFSGPRCTR